MARISSEIKDIEEVRILMIGDRGTGKTSLIYSLVTDEFQDDVPECADEITVAADVTPEQVPTHIVDSVFTGDNEDIIGEEIKRANVICLVYAVNDYASFEHVEEYWLPLLRRLLIRQVPVILAGNKTDEGKDDRLTDAKVEAVVNAFEMVEISVDCSAKTSENLSELFYYAQKTVLHPSSPLYSVEDGKLNHECVVALSRIFTIVDTDQDGLLNDGELRAFQAFYFDTGLSEQQLFKMKNFVEQSCQGGLREGNLTLQGFLFVQQSFIEMGRHESTWAVLRKFGYNTHLELREDYLYPLPVLPPGSHVELSSNGISYLEILFDKFDKDADGALSPHEVKGLCELSPLGLPWDPSLELQTLVQTNGNGWPTKKGFLSLWQFLMYYEYKRAISYITVSGYEFAMGQPPVQSLNVFRPQAPTKGRERNVYRCCVYGPLRCGKSCFVNSFIGSHQNVIVPDTRLPIDRQSVCVNCIPGSIISGTNKDTFLILEEKAEDPISSDLIIITYDTTQGYSFSEALDIKQDLEKFQHPFMVIGLKSDLESARQSTQLQPREFCHRNNLANPLFFSSMGSEKKLQDSFSYVSRIVRNPHASHSKGFSDWLLVGGMVVMVTIVLGMIAYRSRSFSMKK
ncbi:Mitochondrial Rho GTPase 1-A isoform X3 [Oopsacas minuta]|uniref:Mitochondrial Rho GTPase n=1 Tax=Oopsacas minuta TaxID=111878 RepID=A0AAV7JTF3_9METZ|nr:Mitochondrial Rho GTPase 1-A isoform X3 [Oopsacas minuta]